MSENAPTSHQREPGDPWFRCGPKSALRPGTQETGYSDQTSAYPEWLSSASTRPELRPREPPHRTPSLELIVQGLRSLAIGQPLELPPHGQETGKRG